MDKHKKSSIYYGVSKKKITGIYRVRVRVGGVDIIIGNFTDEYSAAKAYDEFIIINKLNKRLNFPEPEPANLIPNTRLIRLTQGKFTIVDEEDFEELSKYNWIARRFKRTWYVGREVKINGRSTTQHMHRVILKNPDLFVDHINGNGLDNRKCNLRVCTQGQNNMNRKATENRTIKFKGVSPSQWHGGFTARIKQKYLGTFDTIEEAAKAYDAKAKELFGEFACLNFKQ